MQELPKTLKGFAFNGKDNLKLIEKPLRALNDDEVLVQNTAVGLNPVDYKLLSSFDEARANQIMGVDGVGVILASKSPFVRPQTRVAYHADLNHDGSFADFSIVKTKALLYLPSFLSDITAASLPCPALTAMQALQKVPYLEGKKVLVFGAGGAVGRILCSLLVMKKAKITALSSPRHHKALLDLGVNMCCDYQDFSKKEGEFYALFDCLGLKNANEWQKILGYYGHFISLLGKVANALPSFSTCISLHEIALGAIYTHGSKEDFILLQENAHYIFNHSPKLLLPPLEVIDFKAIPQTLKRLKNNNEGLKFVAKI